ncbi:MAG: HAD family hydrolase [Candidatus Omnitrophota bacterium]
MVKLTLRGIKLVIFDLDGTLVDAYPAITSSFNHTLQRLGYPKKDKLTIRRAVGWGDRNLLKPFVRGKDLDEALAIYRQDHRKSLLVKSRLFPSAQRVLACLKDKGYKLAIASNRPTRFSKILIRHLKLGEYFEYVLCGDKLKNMKPHPQILRNIMQRFSVRPIDTLYIGDMTIDAQAGRRAKVRTIIVTTGSNTKAELRRERPYLIIDRISELLRLL